MPWYAYLMHTHIISWINQLLLRWMRDTENTTHTHTHTHERTVNQYQCIPNVPRSRSVFCSLHKNEGIVLLLLASIAHTMYSNQYFNFLSVFFYIHFFVLRFKSYQCISTLVSPIKFVRFGRHCKDKTKLFYWFVCLFIVNFLQLYYTL